MQTTHDVLAVVDIGTVTARLAVAETREGGVTLIDRVSTICNLGVGVDRTGVLDEQACERVVTCVAGYVERARAAGARAIACTLTSAARDARNSDVVLGGLRALGLDPQVIPGEVEGRLTFLGVAQDFPQTRLLVADNGGGSTEIGCGSLNPEGLAVDLVRSTNVGCRRITDKFLSRTDPPSADDLREGHEFAASLFAPVMDELRSLGATAERLVVTGGTVTTLVAIEKALVPYDSSQVHLATLTREQVKGLEERLGRLTVAQRGELAGMQVKRAPVILAGTVAIGELMAQTGFDELTVSESDLLMGMSLTLAAALHGDPSPVGWVPIFARL